MITGPVIPCQPGWPGATVYCVPYPNCCQGIIVEVHRSWWQWTPGSYGQAALVIVVAGLLLACCWLLVICRRRPVRGS
ncbi:MAG TPA: hypothetical protein VH478_04580 [Trebonia sp.]|jgi:hypothetical protein|nr:hypothetical protein [Trebonia sp.]